MRLRKRMMKVASKEFTFDELTNDQKAKVIDVLKEEVDGEIQRWSNALVNEETKDKGYKVEIDFKFKYEYVAEEDGDLMEADLKNSKLKSFELNDSDLFGSKFNIEKVMRNLANEYSEKDDYPDEVDIEYLFEDIDIYKAMSEFKYDIENDSLKVNCKIPKGYYFELDRRTNYKDYGIYPSLQNFLEVRLSTEIEDIINEDLEMTIELNDGNGLTDYSPSNIMKEDLSGLKLTFIEDDPNNGLSEETISKFRSFKIKSSLL
jgi:hypothetical protein